jgi:hypothetical protein
VKRPFNLTPQFSLQVWEEEGGAWLSVEALTSHTLSNTPTTRLEENFSRAGNSQKELYFYKFKQGLKEKVTRERGATSLPKQKRPQHRRSP